MPRSGASDPSLPDQAQRELILTELDRSMLVEAAAGTGKTFSMVGRMVALLRTGRCEAIRTMAAVTFTRKAAAELRSRFQLGLEEGLNRASGQERRRLARALDRVEQCSIGTIHAFCARLLRERPVEAGVSLAFEEIDPDEDRRLRREAFGTLVERLLVDDSGGLLAKLERLGLGIRELEPAFWVYADYPDVTCWPTPPQEAALPDLEPTIAALESYLQHMQRLAPRIPESYGNDTIIPEYRRLPRVIGHLGDLRSSPVRLMQALARFDYRSKQVVQREWKRSGQFTQAEAKAELARWNLFRQQHVVPILTAWYEVRYRPALEVMHRAKEIYERLRLARGRLNYQDLLVKAAALLRDKPHVRRYFGARFTHLLVDELQDTDPVQAEVMLLLTSSDPRQQDWRQCRPRPGSLFVVGDPKQSIYRFRRADIVTYNEVKQIIGAAGGQVVRLQTNFRTIGSVVDWVNGVFEPLFPEHAVDEQPEYVPLRTARQSSPRGPDVSPEQLGGVRVLRIPEEHGATNEAAVVYEADRIARTIRYALDQQMTVSRSRALGLPPEVTPTDFMIVTMKRANLGVYARALQQYGIPHAVTGGNALNQVEAVRLLHICLRAVVLPDDPVALVAALRSELFGISDADLYAFKRAGGTFCYSIYHLPGSLPNGLEHQTTDALGDAFIRLNRYSRWLDELVPLAAIERIVADLGLMVLACTGSDVEAGSLAKAIEILRAAQPELWSAAQLVDHLGMLVSEQELHDGISALQRERPAVRVMNLHKVKGLEAPVVFLADPTGRRRELDDDISWHVDRGGDQVLGYLAVNGPPVGWRAPRLAQPPQWAELAAREQAFLRAEGLRLLYVAATRAACLLVISQRERRNDLNPWEPFARSMERLGTPELADPGPQRAPPRPEKDPEKDSEKYPEKYPEEPLEEQTVREALEEITRRQQEVQRPTYHTSAAKRYALRQPAPAHETAHVEPEPPELEPEILEAAASSTEGEHGVEWGAVIHRLLQVAMKHPDADMLELATAVLAEQELDPDQAEVAASMVRSVMRSDLWARAQKSERQLVEVPFSVLMDQTVVRGVIDLVFREASGWVVVDYKTEPLRGRSLDALVRRHAPQVYLYARAWERCTGEPVKETGLYFIEGEIYRPVSSSS